VYTLEVQVHIRDGGADAFHGVVFLVARHSEVGVLLLEVLGCVLGDVLRLGSLAVVGLGHVLLFGEAILLSITDFLAVAVGAARSVSTVVLTVFDVVPVVEAVGAGFFALPVSFVTCLVVGLGGGRGGRLNVLVFGDLPMSLVLVGVVEKKCLVFLVHLVIYGGVVVDKGPVREEALVVPRKRRINLGDNLRQ
jgi:hypothetical protein